MHSPIICLILYFLLASASQVYPHDEPSRGFEVRTPNYTDIECRTLNMNTEGPKRISVHVTVVIDPVNITAFLEALKPAFDAVTNEPLNTFFAVFQSPTNRGEFRGVEQWSEDIDYFNSVQLKKPYYVPYLAVTEPMWLQPRQFEFFEKLHQADWLRTKM